MANFPTLKTGAVSQYPTALRTIFGATSAVEFLDGSSQRYCAGAAPLRQWVVQLERLDARESAVVRSFLADHVDGTFGFTDPVTGTVVPRCSLRDLELRLTANSALNEQMSFVIEELP